MNGFELSGDLLDDFKKWLRKKSKKAVIEKSLPMKEEWVKMSKNLDKLREKHDKIHSEIESEKKKMWATIELDLNDFSSDKRINDKTNEIEFLKGDDDDEKTGVPSPFSFED